MIYSEDTIAALITPAGYGAVNVVRISGKNSFNIMNILTKGKIDSINVLTHTIHYVNIYNENSEVIDDVLISIFKSPNSYTGEDVIELSLHGNPIITKLLFEILYDIGVRQAEPGEFTKRAYLNGKLDLVQAEAVAEIISSRGEASLRGARNQLNGRLSAKINELRSELLNAASLVELELDFSDEDVEFLSKPNLISRIGKIQKCLQELIDSYRYGRVVSDGINMVIAGAPNVGKSSILNYLLKESRAIVSNIPGTTRDIIREEITIDGISFKIFDTAGLRETTDIVESEGVKRSKDAISNADIVLIVNDVFNLNSHELLIDVSKICGREKIIEIVNKSDLDIEKAGDERLWISAKHGLGFIELYDLIIKKAVGFSNYTEKNAIVSNVRHYNCLKESSSFLKVALSTIESGLTGEFVSVDLRNALNELGEIIGVVTTDDLLNNIFQKFCIGK